MTFRSYGAEIVSDVALGQHEPDAYSAFELHRIQRSKHHRIQRAPASPRGYLREALFTLRLAKQNLGNPVLLLLRGK